MRLLYLNKLPGEIEEGCQYTNGILLHSIPNDLLEQNPIEWTEMEMSRCPKMAFRHFSDAMIDYHESTLFLPFRLVPD